MRKKTKGEEILRLMDYKEAYLPVDHGIVKLMEMKRWFVAGNEEISRSIEDYWKDYENFLTFIIGWVLSS